MSPRRSIFRLTLGTVHLRNSICCIMSRTKQTARHPGHSPARKIEPPAVTRDGDIKNGSNYRSDYNKPWNTSVVWWENGSPKMVMMWFPNRKMFSHTWWKHTTKSSNETFQMFCQWLTLFSTHYKVDGQDLVFDKRAGFIFSDIADPTWTNWGKVWEFLTNQLEKDEIITVRVISIDEVVLLGDRGTRTLARNATTTRKRKRVGDDDDDDDDAIDDSETSNSDDADET